MTRAPTRRLADVATKVGVSEATVSRVLNGKPGVSASTREAVLTALDVLGYERPTQLRGERARLIGLVLPELQNPIFPALAEVVAKGDESYFVEAEAVLSLGKTRDERAFAHLTEALKRDSYLEVIRTHAIAGMAELRDERAIDIARDYSAYGRPARARVAAVGTLARFAALKENRRIEILDLMTPLVDDREFMVRMRIPSAFSEVGDPRALPALRRLADRDLDGRIQRHANDAITAISEGRSRVEEGQRLREDIDKLRDDNKKLQERLEKIEAVARDKPA